MKWLNKGKILYWLRSVHRDLGFLLVGVCFIYGISGFLLNHMNGKDPAFKTRKEVIDIEGNLTKEELEKQWLEILRLPPVKKIISTDNTHIKVMCERGMGIYTVPKGKLEYEIHQKRPFVYWVNKPLNPQLHSRSATYIKRNGLLIRKITIKSSRPFQCAYHPLTP